MTIIERQRGKGIFTDKIFFRLNYIPEKVYECEEMDKVAKFFADFLDYNVSDDIFLVGPSGTGKTLSALYLVKELFDLSTQKIGKSYVNCRTNSTEYGAIQQIAFDLGVKLPARGLGTSEGYKRTFESIKDYDRILIILDEVEKLKDLTNIVYAFTRGNEVFGVDVPISLIFITNNIHIFQRLDVPTKSSLHLHSVVFDRYNADELYKILVDRARFGLKSDCYDETSLRYIAAKTAKITGDARLAILSLEMAGKYCEVNKVATISPEVIDKTFGEAMDALELNTLYKINFQPLLILYSLATLAKNTEEAIYIKKIYERYKTLCISAGEDILSYSQFHHHLSYLQSQDTILLTREKHFKGGYRVLAQLNILPDGVRKIFNERLQEGALPAYSLSIPIALFVTPNCFGFFDDTISNGRGSPC